MAADEQVPVGSDVEAQLRTLTRRVEELTGQLAALEGAGGAPVPPGTFRMTPPPACEAGTGEAQVPGPVPGPVAVDPVPGPVAGDSAPDTRISRRGALALGAAAAVGIGALADSVLSATPAGATTGNMQYGASNNAGTSATDLTSSTTAQTLSVENSGNGSALTVSGGIGNNTLAATTDGDYSGIYSDTTVSATGACFLGYSNGGGSILQGFITDATSIQLGIYAETAGLGVPLSAYAPNTGNGQPCIYGVTKGNGPGIEVQSTSGYGVQAQGGSAPLYLVPAGTPGAPTTGGHTVGEVYVDSLGVVYVCTAFGFPGTWVPVLVGGATNDTADTETTLTSTVAQVALTVENTSTNTGATALVGSDGGSGLGVGVRGECDNPANTSAAVEGITNGTGAGVAGACLGNGYGGVLSGGLAPLLLYPAPTAGPPTTGTHQLGELYVDSDGVQYRCAAAGTPGTWVPQYSVVPLPAPVRVINTTTGEGGISGPLVPGATVHTSSVLTGANGIPDGAVGIVANLAVSGVGGALLNGYGVMTIFPAGAATPATANINAGAGSFAESNAVTVAFGTGANAGKVSIVWNGGGPVPNAQAYLDVIAYLL
jgi:hypothetical protein